MTTFSTSNQTISFTIISLTIVMNYKEKGYQQNVNGYSLDLCNTLYKSKKGNVQQKRKDNEQKCSVLV